MMARHAGSSADAGVASVELPHEVLEGDALGAPKLRGSVLGTLLVGVGLVVRRSRLEDSARSR